VGPEENPSEKVVSPSKMVVLPSTKWWLNRQEMDSV
jgi:hypothetical protein